VAPGFDVAGNQVRTIGYAGYAAPLFDLFDPDLKETLPSASVHERVLCCFIQIAGRGDLSFNGVFAIE
jgi:hypothetical protein